MRRDILYAARQLVAIVILRGTVAVVIPAAIVSSGHHGTFGWPLSPPLSRLQAAAGPILLAVSLILMYKAIALFVIVGKGTLAPWDPPQKFVVRGVYRYVRNPMISGVLFVLLGEATLLGSTALLLWFAFFLVLNLIYIPLLEEPVLADRFGEEYLEYKQNVPRWIPRLKPWSPPTAGHEVSNV